VATYIVGDIQGCFDELQQLLAQAEFNPEQDSLWLAGDLVARGPKSLETLRYIKSLGDAAVVVLGNHDLHLMAVYHGINPVKKKDKTAAIFDAPDCDEIMQWLRQQPIFAEHQGFIMCHAGISPQWDLPTARSCADEISQLLKSERWIWLLKNMYQNLPDSWEQGLTGIERYCYIINAFTRMRFVYSDMRLDMQCKLPPDQASDEGLIPWFLHSKRIKLEKPILFGHWAALMGHQDDHTIGLDTGCVWGGELTMLRWEDKRVFTQQAL